MRTLARQMVLSGREQRWLVYSLPEASEGHRASMLSFQKADPAEGGPHGVGSFAGIPVRWVTLPMMKLESGEFQILDESDQYQQAALAAWKNAAAHAAQRVTR